MDAGIGVGEFPVSIATNEGNHGHGGGEKEDFYRPGTPASVMEELRPPAGTIPYLVPKANVSRESLHSLSDPRDNPYAAIYTSAPPSPGLGNVSPFSDQASISGTSSRHLLNPGEDSKFNPSLKPPPRVPSPLAYSPPQFTQPLSSEINEQPSVPTPGHRRASAEPQQASLRSPLRERQFQEEAPSLAQNTPLMQGIETSRPDFDKNAEPKQVPPDPTQHFPNFAASSLSKSDGPRLEIEIPDPLLHSEAENLSKPEQRSANLSQELQHADYDSSTAEFGEARHHFDNEADEDRAKRIQSVYREYWNDSHYYDGSEEWEALPHQTPPETLKQPQAVRPANYDKRAWRDSAQDYYEGQEWHHQQEYTHHNHDVYSHPFERGSLDSGLRSHYSSTARPSYHSRPSTSYSTTSIVGRAQTPQLTEPLTELPSARYKLDDLASPIAYSKPKRFIGPAGRDSPVSRAASPVHVLTPSWCTLAELPVPHRLRRSGSFSSINFAPTRKYAGSEVDTGDTGSIRSLARTEASLMAVSAGAGRVNRLPQDIVPVGKAGLLASLRPENYTDVRYG